MCCLATIIAFSYGINREKSGTVSDSSFSNNDIIISTASNTVSDKVSEQQSAKVETARKNAVVQYFSTQKEGIIGSYAGKQTDNPADNVFTVDIVGEVSQNDKVWLNYELSGLEDFTCVPHSINDMLAQGGYLVKKTDKSSLQREQINPSWLKKGINRITFSLPENADFGYGIKNLFVEIEKNTDSTPLLVVNTSTVSYDNQVYIRGFVQNAQMQSVLIANKSVKIIDGEFETVAALPADKKIEITATLQNGKKLNKELVFNNHSTADFAFAFNNNAEQTEKTFKKGVADELKLATASLQLDSATLLAKTTNVNISTLRHIDLPALDMGMTNVTAEINGYRFLPHGEHFADGATVSIKYDRTKIPNGFTEDDIKTFYFDLESRHWAALERDSIDKSNQLIVSRTTHFTDMINGVIQTPESPETQGFAPTMLNDIKAADPTAKVQLIAPPTANNRGSAGLSYSFEMPPARNGMQPSLGIQYNSDGGSGSLGEGWDLSVQSITVDTRWGVPRYNSQKETETYSMSGTMLMMMDDSGQSAVAHRGDKINRTADRQFYARNEGGFAKIVRKGNSPSSYTWEITDKSGTKYTYGQAGTLKGNITTIDGQQKEVIAEWKLTRVEELHGDWIEYVYETVNEPVRGSLTAKSIYLSQIRAGNKNGDAHTTVNIVYKNTLKQKQTNSGRYGFLNSNNRLLDRVEISFENELLRAYAFDYAQGAFDADMLTAVRHLDPQGNLFAEHTMDYYDDVKSNEGYKPFKSEAETWNMPDDNIEAGFINPLSQFGIPGFSDRATALGGSQSHSYSGSFSAGVGAINGDFITKSGTIGGNIGYSYGTNEGLSTLIDLNGDGLADKVFKWFGSLYYRPNITLAGDTVIRYGQPLPVQGINDFSKGSSNSYNYGAQVNIGILATTAVTGISESKSTSKTKVYFTDVNNDGLIDIVSNGKVYFNHIEFDANGNAVPTFTLSSADTPSPIMGGGVIDAGDTEVDEEEQADLIKYSPLLDVVRVWEAPFSGTVQISGSVQLQLPSGNYDADAYEKADGVRVAIQSGNTEQWSQVIAKGDATVYQANVPNIQTVKGQKIYFRVQSGNTEMANGAFDRVKWLPTITYTGKISQTNPDGQGTAVFKAEEGFVTGAEGTVIVNDTAQIAVSGRFVKPVTSDNVTLHIVLSNDPVNEDGTANAAFATDTVYSHTFGWNESIDSLLNLSIHNTVQGKNLHFIAASPSNVAWEKVKWQPSVQYTVSGAVTTLASSVDYRMYSAQLHEGQAYQVAQDGYLNIQPLLLPRLPMPAPNGKFTLTVKKEAELLLAREITVTNGVCAPARIDSIPVQAGNIWVEYTYKEGNNFAAGTDSVKATVTAYNDGYSNMVTFPVNAFAARSNDGFGLMHRSWGQFVYNANDGRYAQPIDQSKLRLPESEEEQPDPATMVFLPMGLYGETKTFWQGQDPNAYINDSIISSSRLGTQDVVLTNPLANLSNSTDAEGTCLSGSTAFGIDLETKSSSKAVMTGAAGITYSHSTGESETRTSFSDMNGDGYPDIITTNQIQLTNTQGGFDGEIISGISSHRSENSANSFGFGGNPVHSYSVMSAGAKYSTSVKTTAKASGEAAKNDAKQKENDAKIAFENAQNQKPPFSVSADVPLNKDWAVETIMDINGDGLPDRILSSKQVQLNLGYCFAEPADWDLDKLEIGKTTSINAGMGFDFGGSSYSAGFGLTTAFSHSDYSFIDLNADGLPDKVRKDDDDIYVAFNNGNGFEAEIQWEKLNSIRKSSSTAESVNVGATVPVNIPVLGIKITLSASASVGQTMDRQTYDIRDIDGDGFPEIVMTGSESEMTVYRSTIARTNKLKSVHNPLGGSFTLNYARSQASYEHPSGKWVMRSIELNDGLADDGANTKTLFEYSDGKHDRHEREFLGFAKVQTVNIDTENENAVYRKATQEYDVQSVYTAGNETRTAIEDAQGNIYTENINEYYLYSVTATDGNYSFAPNSAICSDRAIAFAPVKYSKSAVYEGTPDGITANEIFYEYYLNNNFGELKNYIYSDKGSLGSSGTGAYNYKTYIEYTNNPAKHIFSLPVKVQVKDNGGTLYRETEAQYDLNYANHLTKITQTLNGQNDKAVIDIEYDRYGNITKKTLPANSQGQRMFYKYLYDRDYNTYVERVEDAFGYRSEMEDYDYRFGIPRTIRDMNGYTQETEIDNLGRITKILAPNEQVIGAPYTIKFEYLPSGEGWGGVALTKHYDPQHPDNDIETVTFVDGFGRAVQVKKDGAVYENGADSEVMIVSGRAKFDAFGRVKEAYYPVSEATGNKTVFNATFDNITPTVTQYDILDRAVKVTLPDGSETVTAYTLAPLPPEGGLRGAVLVTTVTDALGGSQATFANGSGLTVKTEQYSGDNGVITTRFEFDPINQLLKAIDNGGNETVSAYDLAGRRTQVTHPVSGETSFVYDNASNLLSKQTANLKAEGKTVAYEYEYNRLTGVTYPNHPENNVRYTYGNKNASYNRVGRLMLQEDGSGAQEFKYDRLGNIESVRRTLIIPNQAIATYLTQWKYDSWNRLEEMIYPDNEKITYSYNLGGLLESVKGEKAYSYNYVNKLGYDKFEQRIYMKYCNGAETNYAYDPQRRRLSNLTVSKTPPEGAGGLLIMNNTYSYDAVDNVLSVINAPTTPPVGAGGLGGQMSHTYSYDGLYRLTSATGTYAAGNKTASYTLEMQYDNLHNIVSKKQHLQQSNVQFNGILKAGYELNYNYENNPFQISTLQDENYRTEGQNTPNDLTKKEHAYEYDLNGNLVYVNTAREKKDGTKTDKNSERKLLWDEENRLEAIDDNGFVSNYWYDAAGERTVKTSGDAEQMYVNGLFSGGNTETAKFTAYVNAYMVVSKGGNYTKHIYIGSQRIVSKLGDLDSYGADPRRIEYAGANVDGANVQYANKYSALQQTIKDRYAAFEVEYYGKDNDDYVNGAGFCCDNNVQNAPARAPQANDNPELFQYYYHSDHLGSTSLITDLDGNVVQHIEYVPFGEVFIEERNNKWNSPYLFNAKELDEETGLYYYGARYYDPRVSLWLSADLMQEKFPNMSTYAYCAQNPVRLIDPNGMDWYEAQDGTKQFDPNITKNSTLKEGEAYLGATYSEKGANYRSDGSIMYSKESDAYSRMISQSDRSKGNESMAALTDQGTLVLPDYKNTSSDTHASVALNDYGYSFKNGNIVDASGNTFNTLATVHTHPGGSGPSTYLVDHYGDLGLAAFHTPYKPVYVLEMDKKQSVSFIVAEPKKRDSNFRYIKYNITSNYSGLNINSLVKGKYSLYDYTKANNFRKILQTSR
ncbi:hypothetical protein FACS189429_1680 [Bacteroidia bacterium]|nr:hypothetical protein FACS189429_1680 [Bacteroidia bacterium]